MKLTKIFRSLLSLVMAVVMVMGMSSAAFAAEAESATIAEAEAKTYTVHVLSSDYGTVETDVTAAAEGDIVTVVPTAAEGYTVTQVGYCTVDAEGKKSKVIEVNADENGVYSFSMPASDIQIGAAFQNGLTMTNNYIGGTKESNYTLYMANDESFVNVRDKSVFVYLNIDKRFFEIEDAVMYLEIRQYSTDGYTVAGRVSYDYEALQALKAKADAENETSYIFKSVEIPLAEGKSFNEGWAEYCVVQFHRDCWTDAIGNPSYRWTYSGDATVLGEDVKAPSPIVWLYNLDENSHRGALIRSILADLGIQAGTINNENLNQNIGYLVEWEGYEAVEDPYSPESYDVEYILMGNLTEVQLDDFIDAMQENNIRVNLKSIPTAWTASKTFAELFDIMAEEDEVLKAAIALDEMIYTAESLDEATYGNSEYWDEFKKALDEAIVALSMDAEESEEGADLYLNARDALQEMYLKVTGKIMLAGELELICEELEDGTYKVSAQLNGELENAEFSYSWNPNGSTEESIILTADQLYKVNLEINGINGFYGEMTAKLSVPKNPDFNVTVSGNSVSVELKAYEKVINTPDVLNYAAELYLNGELADEQQAASAQTLVFDDLEENTEYVVKVYAVNAVGRSNIIEETVQTGSIAENEPTEDETEKPSEDGTNEPSEDEANKPSEDETNKPSEDKNADSTDKETAEPSENETTKAPEKGTDDSVNTGDESAMILWILLTMSILGMSGYAVIKVKNYIK